MVNCGPWAVTRSGRSVRGAWAMVAVDTFDKAQPLARIHGMSAGTSSFAMVADAVDVDAVVVGEPVAVEGEPVLRSPVSPLAPASPAGPDVPSFSADPDESKLKYNRNIGS